MTNGVSSKTLEFPCEKLPLADRLVLVGNDRLPECFGPHVTRADMHRNPSLGPAKEEHLLTRDWVMLSQHVEYPTCGSRGLSQVALLYPRQQSLAVIMPASGWKFRTNLELATVLIQRAAGLFQVAGKRRDHVKPGVCQSLPVTVLSRATGAPHQAVSEQFPPAQLATAGQPLYAALRLSAQVQLGAY